MSLGSPAQLSLFDTERSVRGAGTPGQRASEPRGSPPSIPPPGERTEAPRTQQTLALPELEVVPPPPRDVVLARAEQLAYRLSKELGVPVRLSVTDNRSTMVSFRRGQASLSVRIHHMFLDAPERVVRALADYAGHGSRSAGPVLDDYIRGMQPRIRQERHQAEGLLEPRGRCFDLQEMFERLNAGFFQGCIQARIGWGRMPPRRRRKSIRLGVYDHQTREIRIHPALDRPAVPAFFVEFIVFHEMLHQLFPSSSRSGRRVHHSRAFRDRERAYPFYEAAVRWERENLKVLLRG